MKDKLFYDGNFQVYSILFGVLSPTIVFVLPFLFTQSWFGNYTNTGEIGDTIGGITSPFVAIVASYLTFIAFWVQFRANQFQREDIALERFNTNFYNLLNIHEEITNNLEFEYREGSDEIKYVKGRSLFRFAFEEVVEQTSDNSTYKGMRQLLRDRGLEGYEGSFSPTYLDHYFRCMYRIVKFVDETEVLADKDETVNLGNRSEYVAILRSKLSRHELVWLFYNGLVYGKEKFKPLIEKYSMLKNLRVDLLVHESDVQKYSQNAFGAH